MKANKERLNELDKLSTMTVPECAEYLSLLRGRKIGIVQIYAKIKKYPSCLDIEGTKVKRVKNNSKLKNFNTDMRKIRKYTNEK